MILFLAFRRFAGENKSRRALDRISQETFYYERRKHGIFGSILEVRTRMYFSAIRPQTSRINCALQGANLPRFHRSRDEVSCNMRSSG